MVGEAGVDKRIDVISTAIHFDATVGELTGLDLAYAPPYGNTKDVVNMAGFAAHNQLRNQASFRKQPREEAQLLDVRSNQEYNNHHDPESINIPVVDLRTRLNQLDQDQPVDVLCGIGKRAYYAQRILAQNGFEDVDIIGGGYFLQ